jgi:hypothetical protein
MTSMATTGKSCGWIQRSRSRSVQADRALCSAHTTHLGAAKLRTPFNTVARMPSRKGNFADQVVAGRE